MQNLNKKANQIVSSVLLIIAASIGVSLIFFSVMNLLNNPQLSPESSCTILKINQIIKINYVCFNNVTNEIEITVSRSIDSLKRLSSIDFIINEVSENQRFSCSNTCGSCILPSLGNKRTYYIPIENEIPLTISLIANKCNIDKQDINIC